MKKQVIDKTTTFVTASFGFVAALVSIFLVRQIGERRARELLVGGKLIDADKALQIGLINAVHEQQALKDAHNELQKDLARNSTQAMEKTKEIFTGFIYPDKNKHRGRCKPIKIGEWWSGIDERRNTQIKKNMTLIEKLKPIWGRIAPQTDLLLRLM